ncbi:MAG: cytochrome c [Bacteroidia bacterium]
MKKLLRILLIIAGVVVLLVAAVAIYNIAAPLPTYEARDVNINVSLTSAQLAKGKLLLTECSHCHAGENTNAFVGRELKDMAAFGTIYSANITQDKEDGIGNWTDGQIAYALRTGINPDGKYLSPPMPKWHLLADADIMAIVMALRSDHPAVQPAKTDHPEMELNFLGKMLTRFAFRPLDYPEAPMPVPDTNNTVELGKYLVHAKYLCFECHSKDFSTVNYYEPEKSENFMGGGNVMSTWDGEKITTPNITFDETGIAHYTVEDLGNAVRFGKAPDRPLIQPMPKFTTLDDKEIEAMYAYMKTIKKIRHETPVGVHKEE